MSAWHPLWVTMTIFTGLSVTEKVTYVHVTDLHLDLEAHLLLACRYSKTSCWQTAACALPYVPIP